MLAVLFPLGQVVITRNAASELLPVDVMDALSRHARGRDWGDVDNEDAVSERATLVEDTRLLSVYHASTGQKLWIITSMTTR